jgi:hypothetical protein
MRFLQFATYSLISLAISVNNACQAQNSQQTSQPVVPGSGTTDSMPALRDTLRVPVREEPTAGSLDRTHGEAWHRTSLHISGSMCPACLLELEGKLRAYPGVAFAKIDRPMHSEDPKQDSSSDKGKSAAKPTGDGAVQKSTKKSVSAIIIFDSHTMSLEKLKECIKQEKYKIVDVTDAEFKAALLPEDAPT